jgi:alpha/beta superfamily hydrolase
VVAFESSTAADARAAAVLLHPHPGFGGTRHNNVIEALYRALPPAGVTAVRFDFSSPDVADATAEAIEALGQTTTRPLVLVGYSFGADVAASISDPRLAGWLLVAPPLRTVPLADLRASGDPRPKRLLVPEHDQFSPPAKTGPAVADWLDTTIEVIPGADHFLSGATDMVVVHTLDWVEGIIGAQA